MWVEILEMFSFVFLISILHHALVLVSLSISSSFYLHRNPFLMLVLLVSSYSKRSQSFVADCLHCSVLHFFLDIHFHLITFSGIRAFVWHFYRFVCVSASWHVSQQIYPSLSLSLSFLPARLVMSRRKEGREKLLFARRRRGASNRNFHHVLASNKRRRNVAFVCLWLWAIFVRHVAS